MIRFGLGRERETEKREGRKRGEEANKISYYEGNDLQEATFPVRVLALLGIKILIGEFEGMGVGELVINGL